MFRNPWTPYLMGGGILCLLFALGRTYWLLARDKRERDTPRRGRPVPIHSPTDGHEQNENQKTD